MRDFNIHVFLRHFIWLGFMMRVSFCKSLIGPLGYGRNLVIKAFPEVENYQSNLYEVYMEPYLYEYGRYGTLQAERSEKQLDYERPIPGLRAAVTLQPEGAESSVGGELIFTQLVPNGPVIIEGNVTGLSPGLHGMHVHHTGHLKDGCQDLGPHFIAHYGRHGGPRDPVRHIGDLGNIKVSEDGSVKVRIVDQLISLTGPRSVVGRSLVVAGEDDYGRAGTEESALTGSSGPPVACGTVAYLN